MAGNSGKGAYDPPTVLLRIRRARQQRLKTSQRWIEALLQAREQRALELAEAAGARPEGRAPGAPRLRQIGCARWGEEAGASSRAALSRAPRRRSSTAASTIRKLRDPAGAKLSSVSCMTSSPRTGRKRGM